MPLKAFAKYSLGHGIRLVLLQGSVVDFHASGSDGAGAIKAIVNAANEGCLGGGGVDGAISHAGGQSLFEDREAITPLPPPSPEDDEDSSCDSGPLIPVRCPTGEARMTGPNNDYGSLRVPYVIHAVGPHYRFFPGEEDEADALLRSAYQSSLDCCTVAGIQISTVASSMNGTSTSSNDPDNTAQLSSRPPIEEVAFPLISAGVYRGNKDLAHVLAIGVEAIRDWVADEDRTKKSSLKTIAMCPFTKKEAETLLEVCQALDLEPDGFKKVPAREKE